MTPTSPWSSKLQITEYAHFIMNIHWMAYVEMLMHFNEGYKVHRKTKSPPGLGV